MSEKFKAIVINQEGEKEFTREIKFIEKNFLNTWRCS